MLADAVEQADTFDAAQVADAIRDLSGIETPMGDLSYDASGDLQDQKIYIFQIRDGDWVQVYP